MTDISVTLRPPCLCPSEEHKHGVSIHNPINLGNTLLWITQEWKTLCELVCISIIYHIPNSWLYLLNQLQFLVLITWQNRELFLFFLFWPGFQARKEPQSKSLRPYVLISVGILLFGALAISAVISWYFWQKRKLKKSAPPRALIMDTIEQPGSSRKPRNEYVFLPQS